MTPRQIKLRRLELGLSVAELAAELQVTEKELTAIEEGVSTLYETKAFEEAFERLEERAYATCVGAPVFC